MSLTGAARYGHPMATPERRRRRIRPTTRPEDAAPPGGATVPAPASAAAPSGSRPGVTPAGAASAGQAPGDSTETPAVPPAAAPAAPTVTPADMPSRPMAGRPGREGLAGPSEAMTSPVYDPNTDERLAGAESGAAGEFEGRSAGEFEGRSAGHRLAGSPRHREAGLAGGGQVSSAGGGQPAAVHGQTGGEAGIPHPPGSLTASGDASPTGSDARSSPGHDHADPTTGGRDAASSSDASGHLQGGDAGGWNRPGRPVGGSGRPVAGVSGGSFGGPARPTSESGVLGGDERESERGLRGLVGSGSSQVSVGAAMRARDAARPTGEDVAQAAERLVIVRRNWVPREDLPRR